MKLLANENIPLATVRHLRTAGYDVAAVAEFAPGATDQYVLGRAREEGRILITFDRDYGELVFVRGLPSPLGLIYLRFSPNTALEPAERLSALFASAGDLLEGGFVVLDREGYRRRPLPRP